MTYSAATKQPLLNLFQWSRPEAPNPRLASPISATDTTLSFTSAPKLYDGSVVTGHFLMNVSNSSGFTELIYVPVGKMSVDGLTATDVIRGVRISGLDYTTGDEDYADVHEGDSVVGCAVNAVYALIQQGVLAGTMASGGTGLVLGTEPGAGSETVTLYRTTTAGVRKGVLRWDVTTGKSQFSNDGSTWTAIDDVSASVLVKASATDTTPGYLQDKITLSNGTITITSPGGDENVNLDVKGALADLITDVTATKDEINTALDGANSSVSAANLNTLTGGSSSNASALHKHSSQTTTYFAYENLGNKPIECQWTSSLTSTELGLGETDATRGRSFKFTPSIDVPVVPSMSFRAAEAVNATTAGNLTITMETDDGTGKPSGILVHANATQSILQATLRGWGVTPATRTITWAGAFTLTAGTVYHLVFKISSTQAANHLHIYANDTVGEYENFVNLTQHTFNSATTVWSVLANSYLYAWTPAFNFGFSTELLGSGNASAVAQLPIQCEYFAGLTSTLFQLGNTNANRKRSFSFIPSQDVTTVPSLSYRVCEAVDNATAVGNMTVTLETDNAGQPSGTLVHANATYTITQATQRTAWTATEATAVITWAGAFSLVKGTRYHIVFTCAGTDATNYIKLFGNATSGESQNYLDFPQYSYSVDTTVWTAVANSYLYIWNATVPFGNAVVRTNATYSGRTFSFIGIVSGGASVYTDVEVYESEASNMTGLVVGQNYYLDTNPGNITTTATNYSIIIGTATSSTTIKIQKDINYKVVLYTTGASTPLAVSRTFLPPLRIGSRIRIQARSMAAAGTNHVPTVTFNGASIFAPAFAGVTADQYGNIYGEIIVTGATTATCFARALLSNTSFGTNATIASTKENSDVATVSTTGVLTISLSVAATQVSLVALSIEY